MFRIWDNFLLKIILNLVIELEKIIPTDLKNIKLNQSKYSFLTNEKEAFMMI